jgi:hypothetical protein
MVHPLKLNGNMAIKKVDLTVSQLINDLNNGFTWLKKDDLGCGSIEVKYAANPQQIMAIQKHPALKNVETSLTIFNIIDDTKDETTRETKGSTPDRTSSSKEQPAVSVVDREPILASNEAADIFASL